MCQYEYAKYGTCGHSVIECREVCNVTLWRAGVTGDLILCVPSILGASLTSSGLKQNESLQLTEFVGFSGSCNACIKKFEISDNVRQRDDLFGYITGSRGHLSPDTIFYLQTEQLLTTFPHLLAIDQQLAQENLGLGPVVLFPEMIAKLTWASLQKQQPYKVSGFWATDEGVKPVPELLNSLQCISGTSPQDRQMFVQVLMNNLNVKDFYNDVFRSRGMPYPIFSRLCAQIKNKANSSRPQYGDRAPVVMNHQPMSSHPELFSDSSHYVSPGGDMKNKVGSEDENSMLIFSPARPQQAHGQVAEVAASARQALSDFSESAVEPPQQHQENSDQTAQIPRGSKRSLRSMQEECVEGAAFSGRTHQSHVGQDTSGNPAQRQRYPQHVGPSVLNPHVSHAQASTRASTSQTPMPTLGAPGATSIVSPQGLSTSQSVDVPQQPASQSPGGQFDVAACRAMQVQARAAHAVPIQPLSAAIVQSQTAMLQAAQARAAQPQAPQPQVQLVDATRAQLLQAQYRRSHAPSEMEANQARASQFEVGFNHVVESHGLSTEDAQLGIVRSLKENQEAQVNGTESNLLPDTQSPVQQSLIDPSLIEQSAAIQSAPIPSTIQQSPKELLATDSMATSSPTPQQPSLANMEEIPGKGKGVLPHAVAKATFFLNEREKALAIGHLARAWTAYRRSSQTSLVKERAALWIVNFSLNFRQQWTLSARSGGILSHTTLAQLSRSRSGVRSKNTSEPASAASVARSQVHPGHNVGVDQTARQQLKMRCRQAQNATPGYASGPGNPSQQPIQHEDPMISCSGSDVGGGIHMGTPMTPFGSGI